jgi:hypothetical protein
VHVSRRPDRPQQATNHRALLAAVARQAPSEAALALHAPAAPSAALIAVAADVHPSGEDTEAEAPAENVAPESVGIPKADAAIAEIRTLVSSLRTGKLSTQATTALKAHFETAQKACNNAPGAVSSYTEQVVAILNAGPDVAAARGGPDETAAYDGDVALDYNKVYKYAREEWERTLVPSKSVMYNAHSYNAVATLNTLELQSTDQITELLAIHEHASAAASEHSRDAFPRHFYGALVHAILTYIQDSQSVQIATNNARKALKSAELASQPAGSYDESFGRALMMLAEGDVSAADRAAAIIGASIPLGAKSRARQSHVRRVRDGHGTGPACEP